MLIIESKKSFVPIIFNPMHFELHFGNCYTIGWKNRFNSGIDSILISKSELNKIIIKTHKTFEEISRKGFYIEIIHLITFKRQYLINWSYYNLKDAEDFPKLPDDVLFAHKFGNGLYEFIKFYK